jgi:hypothetical protein
MHGGDTTPLPRVVIVGAGFGGLQAARSLPRAPVRVTVIDRNNYHLFQPLLYQVATAALSSADIAAPIRGVLRRQRNTEVPPRWRTCGSSRGSHACSSHFLRASPHTPRRSSVPWVSRYARARTSKGPMASRLVAALGWLASRAALHPTQFPAPRGHHYNGWPA